MGVSDIFYSLFLCYRAVLYHRVRFELKLYGTVIICIDTMLFDVKDNLNYLLHEFIAVRAGAHVSETFVQNFKDFIHRNRSSNY